MSEATDILHVREQLEDTPYRPLKLIGSGAMGTVYEAEHLRLGKKVVVKLMRPHLSADLRDRLRLEAQALARVHHDNIVGVLDWNSLADGRPYMVMEHLSGDSVSELLEKSPTGLPVAQALDIARQTLGGLHAVHQAGFVHRDMKPSNLFVCDPGGRLKLLDFGIVKLLETAQNVAPLEQPTREGLTLGTPRYMAPEQALGLKVDCRTDVYAIGVVLYEMLTGRTPFDAYDDVTELLTAHCREKPKPPSRVAQQAIAARLDKMVLKALAKDPAERFAHALEFAGELYTLDETYSKLALELGLAASDGASIDSTIAIPSAPLTRVDGRADAAASPAMTGDGTLIAPEPLYESEAPSTRVEGGSGSREATTRRAGGVAAAPVLAPADALGPGSLAVSSGSRPTPQRGAASAAATRPSAPLLPLEIAATTPGQPLQVSHPVMGPQPTVDAAEFSAAAAQRALPAAMRQGDASAGQAVAAASGELRASGIVHEDSTDQPAPRLVDSWRDRGGRTLFFVFALLSAVATAALALLL